jgi:microcystin-dependent protein
MDMSNLFLGQILLVGFQFAPVDWATCDGQTLQIAEYPQLFELIGTTYGGDGESNFQLPDLRGRAPLSQGSASGLTNYVIGQVGGVEQVALATAQIPSHNHLLAASATGNASAPSSAVVLGTPPSPTSIYASMGGTAAMAGSAVATNGGNQPHENRQPFLTVNYIIALVGVFPSQA